MTGYSTGNAATTALLSTAFANAVVSAPYLTDVSPTGTHPLSHHILSTHSLSTLPL